MPAKPVRDDPQGTVYNPFLFNGTDTELQRLLITGVLVAGKVARQQQDKFQKFELALWRRSGRDAPNLFAGIRRVVAMDGWSGIEDMLKAVKLGKYNLTIAALQRMVAQPVLDLRTCTRDALTVIPGVGMKTASFFILFTRRNAGIACLDAHILRYLRQNGLAPSAPAVTPGSRKRYLELEQVFLKHAAELSRDPGELDFEIWLKNNRGDKMKQKPNTDAAS